MVLLAVPDRVSLTSAVLVTDGAGGKDRTCDRVPERVRPLLRVCDCDPLAVPDADGPDELVREKLGLLLGAVLAVIEIESTDEAVGVEVPLTDKFATVGP